MNTDQQFSEYHIQHILHKTKVIGMTLLIISLIGLGAMVYWYMSWDHPFFLSRFIPDFLQGFLTWIAAFIVIPATMLMPLTLACMTLIIAGALTCLIISILQLTRWVKLKLPHQDYKLAIASIAYSSLTFISYVAVIIFIIYEFCWQS